MTICIGIASEQTRRLYFAADSLVSNDWTQAEGVRKHYELTRGFHWVALYEGTPSTAGGLLKCIAARLSVMPSEAQVQDACRDAYQEAIEERVNIEILAGYGCKYPRFMAEGRQAFGYRRFDKIAAKITEAWKLDASLLVMGFDFGANLSGPIKLCLFEVTNSGKIEDRTQIGYAAIGSGKHAAEDVLNEIDFFNHARDDDAIVYWLAAAKFTAQKRVTSVGWRNTVIVSIDQVAGWSTMFAEDVERLYELWLTATHNPPKRAIQHIRAAFLPMEKLRGRADVIIRRRPRRRR